MDSMDPSIEETASGLGAARFGNPAKGAKTAPAKDVIQTQKESIWKNWRKAINSKTEYYRILDEIDANMQLLLKSEIKARQLLNLPKDHDPADVRERFRSRSKIASRTDQENEIVKHLDELSHLRGQQVQVLKDIPDKAIYDIDYGNATELGQVQPIPNASRTWAALIGIDQYPECRKLNGAVKDAKNMRSYLTKGGVPPHHTFLLVDGSATRQGILDFLYKNLLCNSNIQKGDLIIIHFSGHGSRYPGDTFWEGFEGYVEVICPINRGRTDADGKEVKDITDREICTFLQELRTQKNVKISLVLDCCHSGGAARDVADDLPIRKVEPLDDGKPMLYEAQKSSPWMPTEGIVFEPDWQADLTGIGIIAACQDYELAWERINPPSGWFTHMLISSLKDDPTGTFQNLIKSIGPLPKEECPRQTPVAYGRIDEPFFNLQAQASQQSAKGLPMVLITSRELQKPSESSEDLTRFTNQDQHKDDQKLPDSALPPNQITYSPLMPIPQLRLICTCALLAILPFIICTVFPTSRAR